MVEEQTEQTGGAGQSKDERLKPARTKKWKKLQWKKFPPPGNQPGFEFFRKCGKMENGVREEWRSFKRPPEGGTTSFSQRIDSKRM
jgi:hypothetical protein